MSKQSLISRGTAPLKVGASRARELLEKLLRSRLRGGLLGPAEPRGGTLETFQEKLHLLENHAARYDLPVDFSFLRDRLEALLAVLLEVEDDRLVGDAASGLQEELDASLPRAEALFGSTRFVAEAIGKSEDETDRASLLKLLSSKAYDERLLKWVSRPSASALDETSLIAKGFLRLRETGWTYFGLPIRWEDIDRSDEAHGLAEVAVAARAFANGGTASLAREAVGHLLEWAVRTQGPRDEHARAPWRIRPAADRLLNLTESALALMGSSEFTPEVAHVVLGLVLETARHLHVSVRPDDAPHTLEIAGAALVAAGFVFDMFTESAEWREKGSRILGSAANSEAPDGEALDHLIDAWVFAALASGDERLSDKARGVAASSKRVIFADGRLAGQPQEAARRGEDRMKALALAGELLGEAESGKPIPFGPRPEGRVISVAAGSAHFAMGRSETLALSSPGGEIELLGVEARYVIASSSAGRMDIALNAQIRSVSPDHRQFELLDGDSCLVVALAGPMDASFAFEDRSGVRCAAARPEDPGDILALLLPSDACGPQGVEFEKLPDDLHGAIVRFHDREEAVVFPGRSGATFDGRSIGPNAAVFRRPRSGGPWEKASGIDIAGLDSGALTH